jgi:PhzF family phenazine biosynthesis protein
LEIHQYLVDAFTDRVFGGNPAAVCVLEHPLPDDTMAHIAVENNLSETAFVQKEGDHYRLRWFTPGGEIDLCGHATLATAFVLANFYDTAAEQLVFETMSGTLTVVRKGDFFEMDFPSRKPEPAAMTPELAAAFPQAPLEVYRSRDWMLVFSDEEFVKQYQPDWTKLSQITGAVGVLITAPSKTWDFVSRCFYPSIGVPEDPVTGSAHCSFIPYWAERLGKSHLTAQQVSPRGGTLYCEDCGERVKIKGQAVLFGKGSIYLPEDQ